jgi:putative acetyltransferase
MIRRYHPDDGPALRQVFVRAVKEGAFSRYSAEEIAKWLPDPDMPPGWSDWLGQHLTFVAGGPAKTILGFMMLERDGYLNMAFVLPEVMGKGVADALYARILDEARALHLPRLTVLASRHAQGFFRRHGWVTAPDVTRKGLDPRQGPEDNPMNRPLALEL